MACIASEVSVLLGHNKMYVSGQEEAQSQLLIIKTKCYCEGSLDSGWQILFNVVTSIDFSLQ